MSTLVDSNVLIDVLSEDPRWFEWSAAALAKAVERAALCVNPIIYAEVAVGYSSGAAVDRALAEAQFERLPCRMRRAFSPGARSWNTGVGAGCGRPRCRISTSGRTRWWKITRC